MERQIILRRPWTCRWATFGHVAVPGQATTSGVFWSCAHPGLPDGPKLLVSGTCTECPRWTASARLTAEMDDQLDRKAGTPSAGEQTGGRF
ncbi:MAG: hypothetical protein QGI10_10710 [Vicinamibacterales bacterium]|jgi:hypothetical protein|nr:hypothetical protein [Vicinamibacterales bacterium]MDP7692338.1 hypothetical protein [Vicinamibacterales bacterium]HJN44535.1 hypothetical protein [Vicinamibacterales bacterium]